MGEGGGLPLRLAVALSKALLKLGGKKKVKGVNRRALGVLKAFTLTLPDGGSLLLDVDVDLVSGMSDSGHLASDLSGLFEEVGLAARALVGCGVVGQAAPQQQAQGARVVERVGEVADDEVGQRQVGRGEAVFAVQPGPLQGQVQAFLGAEVIVDQLLVHPGPPGDVGHPGAREAVQGELVQRGGQQGLA